MKVRQGSTSVNLYRTDHCLLVIPLKIRNIETLASVVLSSLLLIYGRSGGDEELLHSPSLIPHSIETASFHLLNNPIGLNRNIDIIPFHPYFSIKDHSYTIFLVIFCMPSIKSYLVLFYFPLVMLPLPTFGFLSSPVAHVQTILPVLFLIFLLCPNSLLSFPFLTLSHLSFPSIALHFSRR